MTQPGHDHQRRGGDAGVQVVGDRPWGPFICVAVQQEEAEDISFDEHGRASRDHYVAWDVLVERSERDIA